MDQAIERALAEAIEEIRSGQKSITEIMARPVAKDPEFLSLLQLAASIRTVENLEPSMTTRQAIRSRVMNEIVSQMENEHNKRSLGSRWFWRRLPVASKLAMTSITLLLALGVTAAGTVQASQDSLPGDVLYGLKLASEQIQVSVAQSPEAKIDVLLEIAQRRTQEMAEMGDRGSVEVDIEVLATRYESSVNEAMKTLAAVNENDGSKGQLIEQLVDNLERHQDRLQEVYEKAPAPAKDAILRAKDTSRDRLETAVEAITRRKADESNSKIKIKDSWPQTHKSMPTATNASRDEKNQGQPARHDAFQTSPTVSNPTAAHSSTVKPSLPEPALSSAPAKRSNGPEPSATTVQSTTTPVPSRSGPTTPGTQIPKANNAKDKRENPESKPTEVPAEAGQQHRAEPTSRAPRWEDRPPAASKEKASKPRPTAMVQPRWEPTSTPPPNPFASPSEKPGKSRGSNVPPSEKPGNSHGSNAPHSEKPGKSHGPKHPPKPGL